jgi:acyl carrier protein
MNEKKLKQCFKESLNIEDSVVNDNFSYGSSVWDSVGHLVLIAAIEEAFDIMLDTEDVISMSSFLKAKEILKKYNVEFNA